VPNSVKEIFTMKKNKMGRVQNQRLNSMSGTERNWRRKKNEAFFKKVKGEIR